METAGEPKRRAAIVYHPGKLDREVLAPLVEAAEAEHGWRPSLWIETAENDSGVGATLQAVESEVDLVIAAGGDGTVRHVAGALRDSDIPLAIVPAGTGNLLARNIKLSLTNRAQQLRIAFAGETTRVDLGVATLRREDKSHDTEYFLVMVGLGLDAQVMAQTNDKLKKRVGWLAYLDAGLRSLVELELFKVRYAAQGRAARSAKVGSVMVGNCGTIQGGVTLFPGAKIDDGLLDIAIVEPRNFWEWSRVFSRVGWQTSKLSRTGFGKQLVKDRGGNAVIKYSRSRVLVVQPEKPRLFQIDGDNVGVVTTVRIGIDSHSLNLRVPGIDKVAALGPAD